jgi:hypothetical protein
MVSMKPRARVYHVLESIQYSILYLLAAFIGGVSLDFWFPHYDPEKSVWTVFQEVVQQCIALVLVVYFVRYCVKGIPILFPVAPGSNYIPYTTPEFNGEMMMGLVFLGSQLNLIQKLDLLAQKLYTWFFKEERKVRGDLVKSTTKAGH